MKAATSLRIMMIALAAGSVMSGLHFGYGLGFEDGVGVGGLRNVAQIADELGEDAVLDAWAGADRGFDLEGMRATAVEVVDRSWLLQYGLLAGLLACMVVVVMMNRRLKDVRFRGVREDGSWADPGKGPGGGYGG